MQRVIPRVQSTAPSPISEALGWLTERPSAAPPLLDVSQAAPGYPPAEALTSHLRDFVSQPESARYSEQLGLPALRQALADDLEEVYGATVGASQVAITAGCNQAFTLTIDALAEPGDAVMLPLPWYFNHNMWLDMRGIETVSIPTDSEGLPDPEATGRALTDRVRALVLVSPGNPSGAVLEPERVFAFARLARDRNVTLILDETYRDFRGDPATVGRPHELFREAHWDRHLVHLYSFSKVYAIPGHRVGALVGSPGLLEHIEKLMDCVAICPPVLGQEAARFGLLNLGNWRDDKSRLLAERLAQFAVALRDSDGGFRLRAAGAFFAWLEHPFNRPSREVARYLAQRRGVLALAGSMFGPPGETTLDRHLRLSFANLDASHYPELVSRLKDIGTLA